MKKIQTWIKLMLCRVADCHDWQQMFRGEDGHWIEVVCMRCGESRGVSRANPSKPAVIYRDPIKRK